MSLLKMNIGKKLKLLIIQIYAPTLQADLNKTENFYKKLQEVYETEK